MSPLAAHATYAAGWLSFGLAHSLVASASGRAFLVRRFGGGHRLAYNAIAAIHIALVLWLGRATLGAQPEFALSGTTAFALSAMFVAGLAVMAVALGGYDLGRLAGTAQWRAAREGRTLAEDEALRIDGLHRYVRHPLYAGAFLVLWGGASDPLGLATALWGSLYLTVGSRCEERKLVRLYGDAYESYRRRVPAFLPWRGRAL